MSQSPTLVEVLEASADVALERVHVSMPGRIEAYDKAKQSARVQPLLPYPAVGEDGARVFRRYAPINDVPVVWLGSGGHSITCPVKPGDQVWLVFVERSLDQWLQNGTLVDPKLERRHHLNDAFAIVGARSFNAPIDDPPDDAMVLTVPDGDELRLGGKDASDPIIRKSDLDAAIQLIRTAIHDGVPVANDGGAALKTSIATLIDNATKPAGSAVIKGV